MTDYTALGLDNNLQPVNSPVAGYSGKDVTGYDFSSNFERNTVTAMNIRDFSFSNGQGGTLALGGSGNGNGVMEVYDTGGTEHVRLDNTGLTVSDGSITLKNAGGTSFVDSKGLIAAAITNYGTTSVSNLGMNVPGTATVNTNYATVSVIVTRNTPVLFLSDVQVSLWHVGGSGTTHFRGYLYSKISVNGTLISQTKNQAERLATYEYNVGSVSTSLHSFNILAAGTYSVTIGGSVAYQTGGDFGTPTCQIDGARLTAFYIGT